MADPVCEERHEDNLRDHGTFKDEIKDLFRVKASKGTLLWTLGIFFVLIIGGYGYSTTVSNKVDKVSHKVDEILTKGDMQKISEDIIRAIQEK